NHEGNRCAKQNMPHTLKSAVRHDRSGNQKDEPQSASSQPGALPRPRGRWLGTGAGWFERVHDGHRTLVICVARHREAHAPGESKVSGRLLVEEDRLDTLRFERDLEALDIAERVTSQQLLHGCPPPLPNGSRLSCGRLARRRKGVGRSPCPTRGTTLRFP